MNKFIETMSVKNAYTFNGAVTNSTTLNACLDLFFLAGACRNETVKNIENKIALAFNENKQKALKIIFWAGDIRQGAGERRFFKIALNWLNRNEQEELNKYIINISELSRWDVLFELDNAKILDFICEILKAENDSRTNLLCKWLPRKKQYNNFALKIQRKLNLTPRQYRKLIVAKTKVVEQQMCKKDWENIKYEHVPSVAMNKYRKAWYRNDEERFTNYVEAVKEGKAKINASVIFPHDIVKNSVLGWGTSPLLDSQIAQWNNLPNYLEGKENSIIPVCDVSGSMSGLPIAISIGLGLYISERNTGSFKDAFITFSSNPTMQYLTGDIKQRLRQLASSDWGMNTDFNKVFSVILQKAIENKLSPFEIPETILVISDMEFDCAGGGRTNFEAIKALYQKFSYPMPKIVFWNVNGRAGNCPITTRDENVALISGASPSIIKSVLTADINPISIMNKTVETERYAFIK